nr:putative atp-dependent rna helicase prh1 [Quercus suber]
MSISGLGTKRKRGDQKSPLAIKKQKLLESRKLLPIWTRQKDIRDALKDKNVLVLSGETGSGKSTQVPQFLLSESWCHAGKIGVTQPRRVAAISLARRVAEEMGSPLGSSSPASKVGYSVRFDDNTSPSTRIKFLTEGMLLQEMLRDAALGQYSCIIVDEVHERSVNVDLILGFLHGLLNGKRRKKPLKVVIMSATADVEGIARFFAATPAVQRIKASNGLQTVSQRDEDDVSERSWNGLSDEDGQQSSQTNKVSTCHVEGRQYPVKLHYLDTPTDDIIEAALQRIFHIHCKEPMPGDLLVFMTGQETIQSLQKLVEEYAQNLTAEFPKMLVLPLFAALPQAAQQRIFQPAPPNTRKVILSTNIAETSVTVPGVRFVVDTGKAKVKQFRNRLGLDSLLVKQISKSSSDQRKGRAGRESAGQCYRLYTEESYKSMDKENTPEILRGDLSAALLTMKARGVDDIMSFGFLTPPPREAMEKALLQLLQLGALNPENGRISSIGRQISRLPLTPALGRVIIEAAKPESDAVLPVIDIVACLSVENIFLNVDTEEVREQAQVARAQLLRRQGDHLTLLAAVQAYAAEMSDRKRWAEDHLISHRAMQSVMDVRKQLIAQCKQAKLLSQESGGKVGEAIAVNEDMQDTILKCFLRGFSNNVARLCPDGTYKTFVGNQTVTIHPSSVLFGRKVEAILYDEICVH